MSHWNYRVVRLTASDDPSAFFEIEEVYYDAAGKPSAYCGASACGDTPEEIRAALGMMAQALDRPVLGIEDFASPSTLIIPGER